MSEWTQNGAKCLFRAQCLINRGFRPAPSTLRAVWVELRQDLGREAEARRTYAIQLRQVVLDPLGHFRVSSIDELAWLVN